MSLEGEINSAVDTAAAAMSSSESTAPDTSAAADAASPKPVAGRGAPSTPSTRARVSAREPVVPEPKPASATVTPPDDGTDPETLLQGQEPIRVDKVKRILANGRTKEAARLATVYGVSEQEFVSEGLAPYVQGLRTNPLEVHRLLGEQLRKAGLLQPEASAPAARAAAATPQTPDASAIPTEEPQPDLRSEDGKAAYSAKATQELLKWQMAQFRNEIGDRYKPIEEEAHERKRAEIRQRANAHGQAEVAEAKKWEGFAELQPKILALMESDQRVTLVSAYNRLYQSEYLPKKNAEMRASLLKEIKNAPPDASSVSPRGAVPRTSGPSGGKKRGVDWDAAVNKAIDSVSGS